MAKRFIDTDIFKKGFVKGLQAPYKLLWIYVINDCNHAGIWEVELDVAASRLGVTFKTDPVEIFGDKIHVFDSGQKWYIPSFIEFQYGELKENNRAHHSVISILSKYGLYPEIKNKPLTSPLQGAMDMDKDKDKDKDKEKSRAKKELDWSICPENFKPIFEVWVSYKAEKGKKYIQRGFQALITEKTKEFPTPQLLSQAVNYSMANNWDGIFAPRSQGKTPAEQKQGIDYLYEPSNNKISGLAEKPEN